MGEAFRASSNTVIAWYPSNLISKIKSGESKGFSALFAIIGGTNSGKVFLAMLTEISGQDVLQSVK
jgi:hypothetical protein